MKNLVLKIFSSRDLNRCTDQSWNLSKNKLLLSVMGRRLRGYVKPLLLWMVYSVYTYMILFSLMKVLKNC